MKSLRSLALSLAVRGAAPSVKWRSRSGSAELVVMVFPPATRSRSGRRRRQEAARSCPA